MSRAITPQLTPYGMPQSWAEKQDRLARKRRDRVLVWGGGAVVRRSPHNQRAGRQAPLRSASVQDAGLLQFKNEEPVRGMPVAGVPTALGINLSSDRPPE